MSSINVLFTWQTTAEGAEIIAGAAPDLEVKAIPYVEPEERRDLRRKGRYDELDRYPMPISDELEKALGEAEVIIGLDYPNNLVTLAPNLRWVQMIGAGIDHLGGTGLMESGVTITVMGGYSSINIAEFVVSFMLNHAKQMKRFIQNQPSGQWTRYWTDSLWGKTVGIVGYGRIGAETARICKGFGMNVLASRRTPSPETPGNIDEMYRADQLHELLPRCDFVVVAVASTPETRRLIGEFELRSMKSTAFLVNVARGDVVDEPVLVQALREGWIGGAGLDVFQQEPLPPDHELWHMENVIATPHTSGAIANYAVHAARFFADNLKRYAEGKSLVNVVDKAKGY